MFTANHSPSHPGIAVHTWAKLVRIWNSYIWLHSPTSYPQGLINILSMAFKSYVLQLSRRLVILYSIDQSKIVKQLPSRNSKASRHIRVLLLYYLNTNTNTSLISHLTPFLLESSPTMVPSFPDHQFSFDLVRYTCTF